MKYMYSVFDKKAGVYCPPFLSHTDSTATRDFRQAANDPSSPVCNFSADYDLYQLGAWDEDSGRIDVCQLPVFVCNAAQLKGTSE